VYGLDKEKMVAINEFVLKSTVPFLGVNEKTGTTGIVGTGCLFKFEERKFIVTAAHVVNEVTKHETSIGIPTSQKTKDVFTLGRCRYATPGDSLVADLDLGFFELSEDFQEQFGNNYQFLSYDNLEFQFRNPRMLVSGFPNSYATSPSGKRAIDAKPLLLTSTLLSDQQKLGIDEANEYSIFVQWSNDFTQFTTINENTPHERDLGGLSGSPIWQYYEYDKIWSPQNCLRIVAIQCSVKSQSWIKGIKIGYLFALFKNYDATIFEKLFSMQGSV